MRENVPRWRQEVLDQRDTLVQEMACDWFALSMTFLEQFDAYRHGKQPGMRLSDVFAFVILISYLIRLVEYFTELASDIANDRPLGQNLKNSRVLGIRSYAISKGGEELLYNVAAQPRLRKIIDIWQENERLAFVDIERRFKGIKEFLETFVEVPFSVALDTCVRGMRARLSDPGISGLYRDWAYETEEGGLSFEQKVDYTLPLFERVAYRDYFKDRHDVLQSLWKTIRVAASQQK